jgi:hypothetical protein
MHRRRGVIRKLVMQPTKWSSNGVKEISCLARDASFVFQHSLVRKFYGFPLPSASEPVVAYCDDIDDGFQHLGRREFVSPTHGMQTRRATVAFKAELTRFELLVKAVQYVG